MTFNQWMDQVDNCVVGKCGLSYLDLPDVCYRDMYDNGYDPNEAANEALEYSGFNDFCDFQ